MLLTRKAYRCRYPLIIFLSALAGIPGSAASVAAQEPDKVAAEALFREGRKLLAEFEIAAACSKFEDSLAMDRALGTLLGLGVCYEKLYKLASAWAMFREAADVADRRGDTESEKMALRHIGALEKRLPRSVIVLDPQASIPGLVVKRNGRPVSEKLFGVPVPVDPGFQEIEASAPGYLPFSASRLLLEGQSGSVHVILRERPPRSEPGNAMRYMWISGYAVGASTLAAGLGFGWSSIIGWNQAFASGACDHDTHACSPEGQRQVQTARRHATAANILVATGLLSIGASIFLQLSDRRRRSRDHAPRIEVHSNGTDVSAVLVGSY